ncbi:unnamed protein product [Caenorhabditis sp. 36 PRJEB53466]|nr:unnamed protein product [Caenorhabditis sp. 36 PRJEB53466]
MKILVVFSAAFLVLSTHGCMLKVSGPTGSMSVLPIASSSDRIATATYSEQDCASACEKMANCMYTLWADNQCNLYQPPQSEAIYQAGTYVVWSKILEGMCTAAVNFLSQSNYVYVNATRKTRYYKDASGQTHVVSYVK